MPSSAGLGRAEGSSKSGGYWCHRWATSGSERAATNRRRSNREQGQEWNELFLFGVANGGGDI